jgi:hypothetical protein
MTEGKRARAKIDNVSAANTQKKINEQQLAITGERRCFLTYANSL